MAQRASLPEEPQADERRISPPASSASSAAPPSPTKSLWKRLLNRNAGAQPEGPVMIPPAVRPASPRATPPASPKAPSEPDADSDAQSPNDAGGDDDAASNQISNINGRRGNQREVVPGLPRTQTFARQQSELRENLLPVVPTPAERRGVSTDRRVPSSRGPQRDVVPGLPRTQTFTRQQDELRANLLPTIQMPAERRGVSADRRYARSVSSPSNSHIFLDPRTSAPNVLYRARPNNSDAAAEPRTTTDVAPEAVPPFPSIPLLNLTDSSSQQPTEEARGDDTTNTAVEGGLNPHVAALPSSQPATSSGDFHAQAHDGLDHYSMNGDFLHEGHLVDTASMTSSQYEHRLRYELEHIWILNLSMHFRDKSRREKFFVTYRQHPDLSRRVTVSLDYRNAPDRSLEMDLLNTKLQRDKNEMIYEAIRESLADIQFYDTVTNLKLQTTDGRLHVHVVEDTTEIIDYPSGQFVHHLNCRKVRESEVEFDSHMSGFVYKVRVHGRTLIKKEIPGPDSVDEFLYEVNALNFLRGSQSVIELYGVVVGDDDRVRGLLISYAGQGALIDVLYENNHGISWSTRMKWAQQIVHGLSEIHEAGFVQGDFTLSNIVIDDDGDAKIIDINRRGCPVGWEPPEATPLIQSDQRISMYIGVKSDLYQLGMVLWALATQYDDPETHGRPLQLGEDVDVPQWYRGIVETCLASDPRDRCQALQLLHYFPRHSHGPSRYDDSDYEDDWAKAPRHPMVYAHSPPSGPVDDDDGSNSFRHQMAGTESFHSVDAHNGDDAAENFSEHERPEFVVNEDKFSNITPIIRSVTPSTDWAYVNFGHTYVDASNGVSNEPYYFPTRGRSPPRKQTRQDSAGRSVSWERTRSLEDQRSHSNETRESRDQDQNQDDKEVAHCPSLPGDDSAPLTGLTSSVSLTRNKAKTTENSTSQKDLKPEEEAMRGSKGERATTETAKLGACNHVDGKTGLEVEHDVVGEEKKEEKKGEKKDKEEEEEEEEEEVTVMETGVSATKNTESKDVDIGAPESPRSPGESYYSLGNGVAPLDVSYRTATPKLEAGAPDDKLLEQIKGVGDVYMDAFRQHSSMHRDGEKDANDEQHDNLESELTALATA